MNPAISVIVPTHDRRGSLLRLLSALGTSSLPFAQFEVIVVADGCTDDTVRAVNAQSFPFAIRVIEQQPGRGPGPARNLGASHAQAAVLLFMDDDIEPFSTTLATHERMHANAEEVVVIGAPVPIRDRGPSLLMIASWGWWEQNFERMSRPYHRFSYSEVLAGVLSLPASLFKVVGGFSDDFARCHEDSELGLRLMRRGTRVVFSRDAGGTHHEIRSYALLFERKRAEGAADVRLVRRYPSLWSVIRLGGTNSPSDGQYARRIAGSAPLLTSLGARMLLPVVELLDAWRFRRTWQRLHGALISYWYWRGVVMEVGGHAEFGAFALHFREAAGNEPLRLEDVDLANGLDTVEQYLEVTRPDALRVFWNRVLVGKIRSQPGSEPLRGAHLRRLIESQLRDALTLTLELTRNRDPNHLPASSAGTDRTAVGTQS